MYIVHLRTLYLLELDHDSSYPPAEAARARIERHADLNAFITVDSGRDGASVAGPVVAVKDLIDVRGMPTTGGGPLAGAPVADRDAAAVARLRDVRAVVIGKTNLYEWGFGVASDNVHHGVVPNPRDRARSAGGSSSGSAAAVAAGLCDWALGTDTAGSVRIPAALCGIVGYKPTFGSIPVTGVIPLSPSQDTLGVLASSVAAAWDAARVLGVPGERAALSGRPLRLAVPERWVHDDLDPAVARAWAAVGETLPRVAFPDRARLFELATEVQAFEAFQVHGRALAETPERYRPEVRERIERGMAIEVSRYDGARAELSRLALEADRALQGLDALLLPTTACVAPLLTEPDPREPLTRFTRPFNATGQPAFSVPLATGSLPIGLQLVGRRGGDAALAAVADAFSAQLEPLG